jgi:hypothetical protein
MNTSLSNNQSAALEQAKSALRQKLFANCKHLPGSLIVELEGSHLFETEQQCQELADRVKPYEHKVVGGQRP